MKSWFSWILFHSSIGESFEYKEPSVLVDDFKPAQKVKCSVSSLRFGKFFRCKGSNPTSFDLRCFSVYCVERFLKVDYEIRRRVRHIIHCSLENPWEIFFCNWNSRDLLFFYFFLLMLRRSSRSSWFRFFFISFFSCFLRFFLDNRLRFTNFRRFRHLKRTWFITKNKFQKWIKKFIVITYCACKFETNDQETLRIKEIRIRHNFWDILLRCGVQIQIIRFKILEFLHRNNRGF